MNEFESKGMPLVDKTVDNEDELTSILLSPFKKFLSKLIEWTQ